jgi:signal transduction histidine kinase/DNA-binding response OmpR family regulator/sensor domain CHASE-containing protein
LNIRNKILLLFFSSVIILIVVLYYFRNTQQHQNEMIIQSAAEQQVVLLNAAINVQSKQLDQIVTDYTNWDEIIVNLEKPNYKWAQSTIGSIINSYNLRSVSVYNTKNQIVYGFGKQSVNILDNPLTRDKIINSVREKGLAHYFQVIDEELLEIAATSIYPTLDTAKVTPAAGFFFISRFWDQNFLKELSQNTVSTVHFGRKPSSEIQLIENDSITISKPLMDYESKVIGYLIFKKPNNVLVNYHKVNDFVFYFLGSLLLCFIFTFYIILYRWIRRPLMIISNSLQNDDTSKLEILKKNNNEFSQIARLISIFHNQKQELEKENIEINQMHTALIRQKSLLQGMALASNHLLTNEDFDSAIHNSLEAISSAAGLDRIFIYKNSSDPSTEERKIIRIHEYITPEIETKVDNKESEVIFYSYNPDSWYSPLTKGKTVKGLAREFQDDLKHLFERQMIKSIMIVPILDLKTHVFWGLVGFADCTNDHNWATDEEMILSMLANNIGGAIRRQHSQEELKVALEMAKSADRAKSEFMASMSHEIRTPMNGVIGMTSLLQLTELTPFQREYVNTIELSGESMMNIINDILDFSKIESGRMELEESSFDLRLCIEDVLDLVAIKVLEKHLDIIYFIDPMVHEYIHCDGFRLRQIIVNLVSNAIKFTKKGDILIYVSTVSQKDENIILEFSVKDSGIGIPPDKIDSLFAPFTQVDASSTRKYGGTGLGLAITSRLVKLMNGEIWVNSQEGIGSEFHFTIQVKNSAPAENVSQVYKSLKSLSDKSVMIVDDNATNRKILTLQCKYWGLKPTAAESGGEALNMLDSNHYDVAILDMQMPEMDGIMLAREIRRKFNKDELPLIMLTSVGFNTEAEELRKLFSYYVNKPIKQSRLAEILLKVIAPAKKQTNIDIQNKETLSEISVKYPFHVLVAEDNLINQKLIRNVFELLGYKIDIAANGIEVLDAIKRKNYDLIFMDIQMPEMNGYEATTIIIEHMKEERPIIIAMTANAMQGDREKCFESGMDDYVTKPMRVNDLIKVIQLWGEKLFSTGKTI